MDPPTTLRGTTVPQRSFSGNRLRGASTDDGHSASRPRPGLDRVGSQGSPANGYPTFLSSAGPENIPMERYTQEPRRLASDPISPSANGPPRSQYINMLVALDGIPAIHNKIAGFFTWILLAGFVAFPGTFTNLQAKAAEEQTSGNAAVGAAQSTTVGAIHHLSLFVVACSCSGIGALGMCWFWYRWQSNYIWLIKNIFMPGALNSVAGVISTLSSVYATYNTTRKFTFSGTSKSTIIATGGLTVVCGMLTVFYKFVLLRNAKNRHDNEYGKRRAGSHGEGYL